MFPYRIFTAAVRSRGVVAKRIDVLVGDRVAISTLVVPDSCWWEGLLPADATEVRLYAERELDSELTDSCPLDLAAGKSTESDLIVCTPDVDRFLGIVAAASSEDFADIVEDAGGEDEDESHVVSETFQYLFPKPGRVRRDDGDEDFVGALL